MQRPCGRRVLIGLVVLVASGSSLEPQVVRDQVVRVRVVDRDSRQPLAGAIVSLVTEAGARVSPAMTNSTGEARVAIPGSGAYRVRAEHIGYAFAMTGLTARPAGAEPIQLALSPHALPLPRVTVKAEQRCRVDPAQGSVAALLWEEVRKALAATVITAQQGTRMELRRYERILDRQQRIVKERATSRVEQRVRPFATAPAEELSARGFQFDVNGVVQYFAPDASLMLSEAFVRDHCFAVGSSAEPSDTALVGLRFEPVPGRSVTDVAGTLWLDRRTRELRRLDFRYTRPPFPTGVGEAGGTIGFGRFPTGAWIVRDWYIRLPRIARVRAGRVGALEIAERDTLVGFHEEGGSVQLSVGETASRARSEDSTVEGVTFDSLRGTPLAGVQVRLAETAGETRTDTLGRYRLRLPSAGRYLLTFSHPTLRRLGVDPIEREVVLSAGRTATVDVAGPGARTLVRLWCPTPAGQTSRRTALLVHVVDSASRASVAGAAIDASWTSVSLTRAERVARVGRADSSMSAVTNESGVAVLCQPPTDAAVRLRADHAGRTAAVTVEQTAAQDVTEGEVVLGGSAEHRGSVRGTVVARHDGGDRAVPSGEVFVPALGRSVTANGEGRFVVENVPYGSYTVIARQVGYRPAVRRTTVSAREDSSLTLALTPLAPELAAVSVTAPGPVSGKMADFDRRRRTVAGGAFLTRELLAKREDSPLTDVLRTLGGARVLRLEGGGSALVSSRGETSMVDPRRRCFYQVYLDGIRIYAPNTDRKTPPPNIEDFSVRSLEGVELYAGPAVTPPEYGGLDASCGTLVMWTRVQ